MNCNTTHYRANSSSVPGDPTFDFFDTVFGRAQYPTPEMFVHGYTFDHWRKRTATAVNPLGFPERRMGDFLTTASGKPATASEWPAIRKGIIERIHWALGKEPPAARFPNPSRPSSPSWWASEGYLGQLVPRRVQGLTASDLAFGDALKGEYYLPYGRTLRAAAPGATLRADAPTPPRPGEKWPVVIWLHPESYASGYARYSFWSPLVANGFAVFAFDQIGFGTRSTQALNFYDRYPQWSLMGKMVADTRAAIDAVSALSTTDTNHIYVAGLGLGAQVGLLTAALDQRVKGVATITGLGALRVVNPDTEGIKRYSHLHGLMPKLGFFVGRESRLPFDFDEVLAAIAPRPVLAVAPTLDRYYPLDEVKSLVAAVEPVYLLLGRENGVELVSPQNFSRFPNSVQKPAYDWIGALAGRPVSPGKETAK